MRFGSHDVVIKATRERDRKKRRIKSITIKKDSKLKTMVVRLMGGKPSLHRFGRSQFHEHIRLSVLTSIDNVRGQVKRMHVRHQPVS